MEQSIKDKVKELEEQNRLLKDNLVDAVWVMNAGTLTYEYITPSIYELSGYTSEELLNTSIEDRLTPESLNKATELLTTALDAYERGNRDAQTMELELIHKDGGTYWVEIRAKLLTEKGCPLKIVGVTRDISNRKRVELQLEQQNQELTDALAEKQKLLEEIRLLRELLPICSGCRRIRDEDGKWWPLDVYVRAHTNSDFTHTICPDCKDVIYPELKK